MARKALELADEHPDAKGDCMYLVYAEDGETATGEGDCLFGRALIALGVDVDWLRVREGKGIDYILTALEQGTDPKTSLAVPISSLGHAQWAQDDGRTWGHTDIRDEIAEFIRGQE